MNFWSVPIDLRVLDLWKPIIDALKDGEPRIRNYAAWVLGTGVQNNSTAQTDVRRTASVS